MTQIMPAKVRNNCTRKCIHVQAKTVPRRVRNRVFEDALASTFDANLVIHSVI